MPLTANRELERFVDQELRSYPVTAATHVRKGAYLGLERVTGCVRGLVAGDLFAGVAYEEADNRDGAAGAGAVRVYTQGDFVAPIAGATGDLIGGPVYATADDTLTMYPPRGASYCGVLLAVTETNRGIVRIRPLATGQVEQAVQAALASSAAGATTNPVLIAQRPLRVISIEVCFNTVPNQGLLDVGTDAADPDELVDAFNLTGLTAHTPAVLPLAGNLVARGQRVWAKVGQAGGIVGIGGLLSMRYVELP